MKTLEGPVLSHDAKPLFLSDFRPLQQVHIARVRPSCASAHRVQRSRLPATFLSLFSHDFATVDLFLFTDLSVHGTIQIAFPLLSYLLHHSASRDPIPITTYIPDRQAGPQGWVVGEPSHPAPKEARTDKVATAIDRISAVAGQLSSPKQGKARILEKNPDDVSRPIFLLLPSYMAALSLPPHLLTRAPPPLP